MEQSTPIINHFVALIRLAGVDDWGNLASNLAESLIQKLNLTVIKSDSHNFSPHGETRGYLLSQSHLAIHTWPEDGVMHVDLVTCSEANLGQFEEGVRPDFLREKIIDLQARKV